jgi:hypothetical protein
VTPRLTRRRFLQLSAASSAATALPWAPGCGDADSIAPRFFDASERRVVAAIAAAISPEDATVGATGCDVVEYIDRSLAALDASSPFVYGAGPFSGREPFPDPTTGDATRDFPPDEFRDPVPLTRLQEASFRIELFGSDAVPNGNINAPIVPPTAGLRALYQEGIAALEGAAAAMGAADFTALDDEDRLAAFATTSPEFQRALLVHVAEGMFAAPEYGGNRDTLGWREYEYDGDSQPLGHTLFDRTTQTLRDRPDEPSEAADPNRPPRPFPADVEGFLTAITAAQGGRRFF